MSVNTPVTIWRETDGFSDSDFDGPNYIVDTVGDFLVDTVGDFVVDTGIVMPATPVTVWAEDDGA